MAYTKQMHIGTSSRDWEEFDNNVSGIDLRFCQCDVTTGNITALLVQYLGGCYSRWGNDGGILINISTNYNG